MNAKYLGGVFGFHGEKRGAKCKLTYRADRDELVGVIHHGDEQIEQDNHIDDGKRAKH